MNLLVLLQFKITMERSFIEIITTMTCHKLNFFQFYQSVYRLNLGWIRTLIQLYVTGILTPLKPETLLL